MLNKDIFLFSVNKTSLSYMHVRHVLHGLFHFATLTYNQ